MKKFTLRLTILIIGCFFSLNAHSQAKGKKQLTLKDAVLKQNTDFRPEQLDQLQWLPEGELYSFMDDQSESQVLMVMDASTGKVVHRISLIDLNGMLRSKENIFEFFPEVRWVKNDQFMAEANHVHYLIDLSTKSGKGVFQLPEAAEAVTFNGDFSACSYVLDHNLFYLKADGVNMQVTSDGKPGIVYGKAVHRNEFGIHSGMFWAPDNKKLAFYRMDETMVTEYPLVDLSTKPAESQPIKYPMAGQSSHHVTLGVFDPAKVKTVYMKTEGPKEQYLTCVTWSPASDKMYIGLLNRDQNQLRLNRYNITDGTLDLKLFEEADAEYIEPENPLWFVPGNDEQFIWQSERSGYNHLYLYDTKGAFLNPITTGLWEVERIIGFDATQQTLFVEGTGEVIIERDGLDDQRNAMHRYTYSVDFNLRIQKLLDDRPGTHVAHISSGGNFLFEHYTSIDTPWETSLWKAEGKKDKVLHVADDPVEDYVIGKPELVTLSTGANQLYGRVIKPSYFDSTKKYPMLLYVYGGPHAQLVRDVYMGAAPMWMYWMAEQGYVIATVDNRGSENRGIEFEQSTFRLLGEMEMADQRAFVDYLIETGYVDKDRMAIHGWSYGGFMTMNLMLTFPGYFKAGVAGGPVCDWSMYEVMYTERYMDTPQTNAEGFKATSLIERADKLEDDLLVIHGTVDDVVLWQHSQLFLKACVDNGVQLDYFVYPGHPHNVRGIDRYHLMEKVLGYIDERLQAE